MLQELALIRPLRFLSPSAFPEDGDTSKGIVAPIGTGPWVHADFKKAEYDVFVRNERYWGPKPAIEKITVKVLPDPESRVIALETGQIDLIYGAGGHAAGQIGLEAFTRVFRQGRFETGVSGPLSSRLLAVNSGRGPTSELAVRRAIQHAVDKDLLVEAIFLGVEKRADYLFAPTMPYCDLGLEPFAFDREKAEGLLDEAGWVFEPGKSVRAKNGQELVVDFCFTGNDALQKAIAESLQGELAKVGLRLNLIGEESDSFLRRQKDGEFGMIFNDTWGAPYEPHAMVGSMRAPSHADYQAQVGLPMKAELDEMIGRVLLADWTIKAVPEGMIIPTCNALVTIENTDPKCFWLTNFLETLLVQVWYPITVATQSYYIKKTILQFLQETGNEDLIDFKLHDFGFRGVSSVESAGIGGLAHLVNFKGTDTMEAITIGKEYYNEPCAGFSIPASEHSTITSWGEENELKAYENMLDKYSEYPIIACVSDSYDIFNACSELWGNQLKEKVMNRNGTLVIRPDSGNPIEIVVKTLNVLWEKFGGKVNSKGYKVLDDHVRVIQGDGVDAGCIYEVLDAMKSSGFSADNIAFGMGGALLQKLDRDTQKFAFKCSAIRKEGKWYDVYKAPATDMLKASKRGRLKLIEVDGDARDEGFTHHTIEEDSPYGKDLLIEVFNNGSLTFEHSLESIRNRK